MKKIVRKNPNDVVREGEKRKRERVSNNGRSKSAKCPQNLQRDRVRKKKVEENANERMDSMTEH